MTVILKVNCYFWKGHHRAPSSHVAAVVVAVVVFVVGGGGDGVVVFVIPGDPFRNHSGRLTGISNPIQRYPRLRCPREIIIPFLEYPNPNDRK